VQKWKKTGWSRDERAPSWLRQCSDDLRFGISGGASFTFPTTFQTKRSANRDDSRANEWLRAPAVVLLHGYGDTGDMWAPLAAS
jgi:hypothetical protein